MASKMKALPAERRAAIADEIIDAYRGGAEIKTLAPKYSLSTGRVYELLLDERQDEWRTAQAGRALSRLEAARAELEAARDPIAINRSDKLIKEAQWQLERLARVYGQSNEPTNAVVINIGIVRRAPVTIEQEK